MSPFRPSGRTIWRVKLPNRHAGWKDISTRTRDKPTANAMDRMLDALGPKGKRDWELLDAVWDGRLELPALFDAYRMNDLASLRARLDDVDLRPYIDRWQDALEARGKGENGKRYKAHLLTLAGEEGPWLRSEFTHEAVDRWFSALTVQPGTRRRYLSAVQSFVDYATRLRVLPKSPLLDLQRPSAPYPDPVFLELEEVLRLVDSTPEPYQTLFAFLYGSGCDLTPALGVHRRDVDLAEHEVNARGKKSRNRGRLLLVAGWAWPWLEARCRDLLPGAPLFPGLSRYGASDVHRERVKALELARPGIRLHAARHHWAVRMIRGGAPIEMVARQLGNDPVTCLRYYGRFIPSAEERKKWEREASERENRRRVATAGATARQKEV